MWLVLSAMGRTMSLGRKWEGLSGTSRLHAIKARLYDSNYGRGEEMSSEEDSPEVEEFAELWEEVLWFDNMSVTSGEIRGVARHCVLVCGGRCGNRDTQGV